MKIKPISLREANEFVETYHRHNDPVRGHKFSIGLLSEEGNLIGVGIGSRPIARVLDDGLTLEISRTCTDGSKNANSMIYGAVCRVAKAMGYVRCITYTRVDESGASLRGAGFVEVERLKARGNWFESTDNEILLKIRDIMKPSGIPRIRWGIRFTGNE